MRGTFASAVPFTMNVGIHASVANSDDYFRRVNPR